MIVNLVIWLLTLYIYRSIKLILSRLGYQNICSKGMQYIMIDFNINLFSFTMSSTFIRFSIKFYLLAKKGR